MGVRGILAEQEIERILAPFDRAPLAADDRRGNHVWRQRARSPGKAANRGIDDKMLHGAGNPGFVLRIPTCLEHRGGDVEEGQARTQLLVPLLTGGLLVTRGE